MHENVVRLICTYVCPSQVLIVTELAAGGELLERQGGNCKLYEMFRPKPADVCDRLSTTGNFSEVDARIIVVQILRAIDYLHSENIVHRDLKVVILKHKRKFVQNNKCLSVFLDVNKIMLKQLENILLSDDVPPVVKVADFGLSRCLSITVCYPRLCDTGCVDCPPKVYIF